MLVMLSVRLQAKLKQEKEALKIKMSMAVYKERTPDAIKAEESRKLERLDAQLQSLSNALLGLDAMRIRSL